MSLTSVLVVESDMVLNSDVVEEDKKKERQWNGNKQQAQST